MKEKKKRERITENLPRSAKAESRRIYFSGQSHRFCRSDGFLQQSLMQKLDRWLSSQLHGQPLKIRVIVSQKSTLDLFSKPRALKIDALEPVRQRLRRPKYHFSALDDPQGIRASPGEKEKTETPKTRFSGARSFACSPTSPRQARSCSGASRADQRSVGPPAAACMLYDEMTTRAFE